MLFVFTIFAIGWTAIGIMFFVLLLAASREPKLDPDIRLRHFPSGWSYSFFDPHGTLVIRTGYGTRRRANRAAVAHRAQVGRQLELSLRLDEVGVEP